MNWLRNFLKRSNPSAELEYQDRSRGTVDLLSATQRDVIVARHLNKHLSTLGLKEVRPRSWIDESKPPAKPMFQLSLLKGAGIKTCWGFSLDFVPHISGRDIRWHRTNRSAILDLVVDPRDQKQLSFLYGAAQLEEELESHLPIAIERARETWRRGETWHGMLEIVQEIREKKTNCFGFYNYTQLPLAFAFLSAKVGDVESAETELKAYIDERALGDESSTKLIKYMRNLNAISKREA